MTAPRDHDIRIISHPLCPYAHRLGLILAAKGWRPGEDYRVQYVDLADLPGWFHTLSPAGRMPVLELRGEVVTFDAELGAEFLDELEGPRLHPVTPLARLEARTAIARVCAVLSRLKDVYVAKSTNALEAATDALFKELALAERAFFRISDRFDGVIRSVDAAAAPMFVLLTFFDLLRDDDRWQALAGLRSWSRHLLSHRSVWETACADPRREFARFFRTNGSAFALVVGPSTAAQGGT